MLPTPAPSAIPIAQPTTVAPAISVPSSPVPEATPAPAIQAVPDATPSSLPNVTAPIAAQPSFTPEPWMWQVLALALATLIAAGAGWWWRKRGLRDEAERRDDRAHEIFVFDTPATPAELPPVPPISPAVIPDEAIAAVPVAPAIAPNLPTPSLPGRATLDLDLVPKRAGTNLLSAAVDYTIVIDNRGDVAATGIRLDVRLLSAGPRQDALIAALFDAPIAQPATAPFDLPPGSAVELGGMALHPKDTLEIMEVSGRALFVPVLTVNVTYGWDAGGESGTGQTARSYVIGIDRGGDAKLQPFRVDAGARMHDAVGALAYTAVAVS